MPAEKKGIQKGVSIVLCTYNGKNRLPETLKALSKQEFQVPCELIVVDNASTDNSLEFAKSWWQENNNSNISFKGLLQPIPGKSFAQDLGYQHASYELLLVCDDDNWLSKHYIQTAYAIMMSNLEIGALGGWCEAEFETTAPEWFHEHKASYAVGKQAITSGDITDKPGYLYGAGMVLRKSHWLELKSVGFEHLLSCRKGNNLSSGGDTEYCLALRLLGYKIWYDERLFFKHYMAQERLNLSYLSRLKKGMTFSNFTIRPYFDLLYKYKPRTYSTTIKKVLIDLLKNGPRHLYYNYFGAYNAKEVAKQFFRLKGLWLFNFSEYKRNTLAINKWVKRITVKINE